MNKNIVLSFALLFPIASAQAASICAESGCDVTMVFEAGGGIEASQNFDIQLGETGFIAGANNENTTGLSSLVFEQGGEIMLSLGNISYPDGSKLTIQGLSKLSVEQTSYIQIENINTQGSLTLDTQTITVQPSETTEQGLYLSSSSIDSNITLTSSEDIYLGAIESAALIDNDIKAVWIGQNTDLGTNDTPLEAFGYISYENKTQSDPAPGDFSLSSRPSFDSWTLSTTTTTPALCSPCGPEPSYSGGFGQVTVTAPKVESFETSVVGEVAIVDIPVNDASFISVVEVEPANLTVELNSIEFAQETESIQDVTPSADEKIEAETTNTPLKGAVHPLFLVLGLLLRLRLFRVFCYLNRQLLAMTLK